MIGQPTKMEQNEEMNYQETVLSMRAFMGWAHIPDFELYFTHSNITHGGARA